MGVNLPDEEFGDLGIMGFKPQRRLWEIHKPFYLEWEPTICYTPLMIHIYIYTYIYVHMYTQCSKHTTSSRFLIWVSGSLGFEEKSIAFGDDLWYTYCLVCFALLGLLGQSAGK